MKLTTIQDKKVLDVLKSGNVYYADFDKIRYEGYKKQWKEVAEYLGFKECPIFCSPENDDTATTASGIEGVKITLDVPKNEYYVMDYYGFADWLYYSDGQEYDSVFNWGADEALKNIDAYLDKDADVVQVVLNRIDPKWVDWSLTEATRKELIDRSKNADVVKSYGTTRYMRRDMQHIYNPKESLNKLDQNSLWKSNTLSFRLPIHGETDNYNIDILFEGILDDINRELRRNNYVCEYKIFYKAIVDAINRQDIYVSCTCADWYYRMSYQATKGRFNAGKPQIIPAKITNPNNTKGAGCKHVMKALADLDWALDLASCINNYVIYMQENYPDKYENLIFPAIYKMTYQRALDDGIIENENEEEIFDDEIIDDIVDEPNDDDIEEVTSDEEEIEDGA